MAKPRVYYDATFLILAPHRGMATYLSNFLEALSSSIENVVGLAPPSLKSQCERDITYYGSKNVLLFEQFSIPAFVKKEDVHYFIFPYNTGPVLTKLNCKSVLVLHDLIFMESFSKIPASASIKQIIGRFYRRMTGPRMLRKADFIITVSEYSKKKIIEGFSICPNKITVIPNCIDVGENNACQEERDRLGYFLNVGGDAPHKNTFFLVKGYSSLPKKTKEAYSLKIVGIANALNKKILKQLIQDLNEEDNITIEEFVDDKKLENLYRGAFIFIFPSLTEGFGIPLLEAMKFGVTIVCSDTSSMPEVCGNAAFYFSPTDVRTFVDAVSIAVSDKELRVLKRKEAIKRLEYYSRSMFNKKVLDWYGENIRKVE